MKLAFGILAHDQRGCLRDLVDQLWVLPETTCVAVYNGGPDPELTAGLRVTAVPSPHPVRWGHGLEQSQFATMGHLTAHDVDFEGLVFLDSDMTVFRADLAARLGPLLAGGYVGGAVQPVHTRTEWMMGRRFASEWSHWQPLLGAPKPYGAYNPGQAVHRTYVEELLRLPRLDALLAQARRARTPCLEEFLLPTLCASLGATLASYPEPQLLHGLHSPAEIRQAVTGPGVGLLHKVVMRTDSPDRLAAARLTADPAAAVDDLQRRWLERPPDPPPVVGRARGAARAARDLATRVGLLASGVRGFRLP